MKVIKSLSYIENGKRFAECRECNQIWNIAIKQKMPKKGYICPRCFFEGRRQKECTNIS